MFEKSLCDNKIPLRENGCSHNAFLSEKKEYMQTILQAMNKT